VQVALRQRTTGLLWIGEYTGSSLLHRASYLEPGMDQVEILGAADFDGDGLDEILGRDLRTGALNFWLVENDELVRDPSFGTADPAWVSIGILDFDRDGQADLWFTTSRGEIWVYFTDQLTHREELGFALPLPGSSAVDVADYDGDGMADLLFRASNGVLTLALLRGDPFGPAVEFRTLPYLAGDDLLAPRTSADLDGRPARRSCSRRPAGPAARWTPCSPPAPTRPSASG